MNRVSAVLGLGVAAFGITLAVYVGTHLSGEAMTVLAGAVCGVSAVMPAAIVGALALLRRREQAQGQSTYLAQSNWHQPTQSLTPSQYPPVIVVAPPQNGIPVNQWPGMYSQSYSAPTSGRQFSIIGEEGVER